MDNLKEILKLSDREDIADDHADIFFNAQKELDQLTGYAEALQIIARVAAGTWAGNYAKIILERQ